MAFFDMGLAQLEKYDPADPAPHDFDAFWKKTLDESAKFPLDPKFVQVVDDAYKLVDVYDVTYRGYLGQAIKGWFLKPARVEEQLPTLVSFVGYGGGRGMPSDHLTPAVAGFCHFVMDTRGQGSGWSQGDTPDNAPDGQGPQVPGYMTRGIDAKESYYYRRVFTDAARAVEAAALNPFVDAKRIGVTGGSQGGGISIAAAALAADRVKIVMPDVPFLCHYRRATTIVDSSPYSEIAIYLKTHRTKIEHVYKTLSYFDGMHFAPRITAKALFSVGLMDMTCPPSTVYAAYNRIKTKKDIKIYEFNNHEGGGSLHSLEKMRFALANL